MATSQPPACLPRSRSRSHSTRPRPRSSSSTCSATSWSRAVSARRSATTCRSWRRAVAPCRAVLAAARDARHAGHPYARRPSARPVRRAAGQGRARRAEHAHRRAGADGPHPDPRRAGPRHHPGALSGSPASPSIDKPGKGAFYATDLDAMLRKPGIETLLVCGVTTEVCVNTTVREANDRGYRCIVLADCCAPTFPNSTRWAWG